MSRIQTEPAASDRDRRTRPNPSVTQAWQKILALTTMMTMVAGFVDASDMPASASSICPS